MGRRSNRTSGPSLVETLRTFPPPRLTPQHAVINNLVALQIRLQKFRFPKSLHPFKNFLDEVL
jgi:hypothetical protein